MTDFASRILMTEDTPDLAPSSRGSTALDAEPARTLGRRGWWIASIFAMVLGIVVIVWGMSRIRRVAPSLAEVEKLIAADRYAEAERLAEAVVAADPIDSHHRLGQPFGFGVAVGGDQLLDLGERGSNPSDTAHSPDDYNDPEHHRENRRYPPPAPAQRARGLCIQRG